MKSWAVPASVHNAGCLHHAGQTTDKVQAFRQRTGTTEGSSIFTPAFHRSVYIWGSTWLLCVSKPWSAHIKLSTYKYSGSPEGSLDFIRGIYRTHPTTASPIATREKHNAFPHWLPHVAPKPSLNSCLYPRLLLPSELHRIKSCLLLWLRRFYTNNVSGKCAKTANQGFHVVVRA